MNGSSGIVATVSEKFRRSLWFVGEGCLNLARAALKRARILFFFFMIVAAIPFYTVHKKHKRNESAALSSLFLGVEISLFLATTCSLCGHEQDRPVSESAGTALLRLVHLQTQGSLVCAATGSCCQLPTAATTAVIATASGLRAEPCE